MFVQSSVCLYSCCTRILYYISSHHNLEFTNGRKGASWSWLPVALTRRTPIHPSCHLPRGQHSPAGGNNKINVLLELWSKCGKLATRRKHTRWPLLSYCKLVIWIQGSVEQIPGFSRCCIAERRECGDTTSSTNGSKVMSECLRLGLFVRTASSSSVSNMYAIVYERTWCSLHLWSKPEN